MIEDPHKALRDDVRLLGTLFGETLRSLEGERLFALVEEVRALAKGAHAGEPGSFDRLADRLSDLPISAGGSARSVNSSSAKRRRTTTARPRWCAPSMCRPWKSNTCAGAPNAG